MALLWCKHLLLNRKKITGEKLWKPQHEIVMPLLSVSGTPYFGGKSMHEQSRSFEFQPPNQYGMSVIQRNDAIQFDLSSYTGSVPSTTLRRISLGEPSSKHAHVPEFVGGNRSCLFCSKNKIRTKNGWYVYSSYKCSRCDVILCTGKRDCFNLYHAAIGIPLTNNVLNQDYVKQ